MSGARKRNRYTPSRSVFVERTVPLDVSVISTFAFGRTALLGSVTIPVKPPEIAV
jgi:hypothetical protein